MPNNGSLEDRTVVVVSRANVGVKRHRVLEIDSKIAFTYPPDRDPKL
ncbi:hypothetical protein CKA32_004882 [Geitlerinema sp. FC II]|nr:hypothetical protein CKA32_004882 [Geitlerinema sp. FC II]